MNGLTLSLKPKSKYDEKKRYLFSLGILAAGLLVGCRLGRCHFSSGQFAGSFRRGQ